MGSSRMRKAGGGWLARLFRRYEQPAWEDYLSTLQPHERPSLPGSPANPDRPILGRLAYAAVGIQIAATGTFGNAVVQANSQTIAGAYGLSQVQAAWIPTVFVMTNACANLMLIKFRQQFGLRFFAEVMLPLFVVISLAHLWATDFTSLLVVRAMSGICSAALSTLGILYLLQAFPAAYRMKGFVIGIGLASFALPLARIYSPALVDVGGWQSVHLFEVGMSLIALAGVFALSLPFSERRKVFEALDFVSVALFAPGVALLCAVLGLGRYLWWPDNAWLGWALAGSVVLLSATFFVEHSRSRPLIDIRWLASGDILRMAAAILLVRIVLSEQTAGAVGFLQQVGMGQDQLRGLFKVILAATIAGTAISAITLSNRRPYPPIAIALALISIGAFMDSHSSVLVRPQNVYVSQSLLAFASALFIGPTMMLGLAPLLQKGATHLVSFIVVFSTGQNIAGLAGSSLVGTVVTMRARGHFVRLAEQIVGTDPAASSRIDQLSGAYARILLDPSQRRIAGLTSLQQQVTQQSQVMAYNDIFAVISIIAGLGALWAAWMHFRAKPPAAPSASPGAAAAAAQAMD